MYLSWLLVPCVLLWCVYALLWLHGRRARKLLAHLPRYPALPFIGNFHQIFGDAHFLVKVLNDVTRIMEETGKPFVAWAGPRPVIIVADPEDVKAVTYTFVEKPYYYNFARDWVGNGLVTAPRYMLHSLAHRRKVACLSIFYRLYFAEIWKRSIKKLAGTFTGNIVDGYQEVFNAQAQKLVDNLKGEAGGEPFDVLHKYLALTTLESICQTALGVPRSDRIVTHEYYRAFNRTFELFIQRGMNIFLHLDWVYRLSPRYKEVMSCIAEMHKVSEAIIATRIKEREEMKKNNTLPVNNPENGKTRFKPFLEILLELRDEDPSMTMWQMRNEVDTIIIGGQETVATTLFFTLLVLGTKTDIQEKVYAELKQIFGDSKRAIQKEDLIQMTYIEAVVNETLRMFPPIPLVMREADRDLQIKSCIIPKGTACGVCAWIAGRSRRLWGEDAQEYRPERWLESDLARTKSGSFLAFSYGKRACIGRRYAIALMKTILAYCIRDLEISSEYDKLQIKIDVTLKAASGHLITVRKRE